MDKIEICVVAKRCVYINNYRVCGGKPYASEGLPQHSFDATVKDVLGAFSTDQISAYLTSKGVK